MKLKALTLENFKGISDQVRIEFSPLTLLFGPNNAGKSTVLHALIYAREIFERGNVDPRFTEMGGDTVDLGGFDSLVFRHDRSRKIRMRFEFDFAAEELRDAIGGIWHYEEEQGLRSKEVYKRWLHKRLRFVEGFLPNVNEALHALRPSWIDLTIGWNSSLRRPIVAECAIGGDDIDRPYVRFAHDEALNQVQLTRLDLGQIPFGRCVTDETLRLANEEPVGHDWDRSYFSPPGLEQSPEEVWRQAFEKAARRNSIDTTELFRGLIHLDLLLPNGDLKPIPVWMLLTFSHGLFGSNVQGSDSALPAKDTWLGLFEHCYPHLVNLTPPTGLGDEECVRQAFENYEPACDWVYPVFVVRSYLEPLVNAVSVGAINCCRKFFRQSLYLSSVRAHPPRDFHAVEPLDPRRWPNGLAAWDLLVAKEEEIVEPLNEWLNRHPNRFGSGFEVGVQRVKQVDAREPVISKLLAGDNELALEEVRAYLANLPEERLLRIRNVASGVLGQPRDVGYGLSQLVPVIVAALNANTGVVSVEEPESNIHPAFQVVLADLFITQAKANPNALFLIETHSEHLMLRCLRRIRETAKGILPEGFPRVAPEDIAVHFVETTKHGPRIERKEIDEDGDFIDEWPGGFFEESYREKFAGR